MFLFLIFPFYLFFINCSTFCFYFNTDNFVILLALRVYCQFLVVSRDIIAVDSLKNKLSLMKNMELP
jgi:hypothetical protein